LVCGFEGVEGLPSLSKEREKARKKGHFLNKSNKHY
jgi:hypothetical protein